MERRRKFQTEMQCFLQGHEVVAGSLFKDRIFVRSKRHRDLLLAFSVRARSSAGGISAEDYEELTGDLADLPNDSPESSLLPFLSADEVGLRRYSTEQHRQLLHILGTSAPACQLLKPVAFAIIQRITDGDMAALQLDMIKPLAARCPHLWAFLRPYMGMAEVPCHVTSLLAALLKVFSSVFCLARTAHGNPCAFWHVSVFLSSAKSSSVCTGGHASV